jgi:hypothetical protein
VLLHYSSFLPFGLQILTDSSRELIHQKLCFKHLLIFPSNTLSFLFSTPSNLSHPDPNPFEPMYDPEKILHKAREQVSDPFYFLDISLSLPKDDAQSIDDLEFDTLFEQTLFRSKS